LATWNKSLGVISRRDFHELKKTTVNEATGAGPMLLKRVNALAGLSHTLP